MTSACSSNLLGYWEAFKVTEDGDATVWLTGIPSPNGIGFSADGAWAYVVTTFGQPAPAWRIPISDGAAGTPESMVEWGPGVAPDGLAVGASGAVYSAQNIAGRIDRVIPGDPHTWETVGEGATWAASNAFGVGDSWDPCAQYITSLFGTDLFVMGVGEPAGTLSLREAESGAWWDIVFHGRREADESVEISQCDGCGDAWYQGARQGQVCVDARALLEWNTTPW